MIVWWVTGTSMSMALRMLHVEQINVVVTWPDDQDRKEGTGLVVCLLERCYRSRSAGFGSVVCLIRE